MALAPNERSQVRNSESVAIDVHEPSESFSRPNPQQSDIRELNNDDLEATKAFEQVGDRRLHDVIWPPPVALESAIEEYARLTQNDTVVSHALRVGDLPQAVAALLQENLRLRREIESSRADFEELRSVNLAIQEQADATLRTADDQRLELLDELERTRGELSELETQIELALERSRERLRTNSEATTQGT